MVADAGEYRIYFWGIVNSFNRGDMVCFQEKENVFNSLFTAGNLIVCSLIGFIMYGAERMKVVPAALIREGIHQTRIPFSKINLVLCIITVAGILMIGLSDIFKIRQAGK